MEKNNKNGKKKLYKKIQDHVVELLDISKILKKLEECEKLKFLLLNLEQLAMFKFIPKSRINCKFSEGQDSDIMHNSFSDITKLKVLYKDKKKLLKFIGNISDSNFLNKQQIIQYDI